ncbi:MAG: hypothetical protein NC251_06265 [Lachnoclostridium sp.]|nr:hypothetical protein [Lachnospira sp.]MCM1248019.1 hypothetical protein [Lachnoclostridium sp.]
MDNAMAVKDFTSKFKKLNKQNQKYILAIEQAMLFAQDSGDEKEREENGGQKDE